MISGIKTAGTLSGHVYGTGEPERKCKGKRMKTRRASPKYRYSFQGRMKP
ncbi:MAG: hypothetical protein Q7T72_03795 [Bacteroidales bacterium]|nr:hypothetical protein [Bacteroidales bacterium]